MKKRVFHTRIIAYKKKDIYIGVALDFDLVVQGDSIQQALQHLHESITGYLLMCVEDNESHEQIYRPAPKKYFDLHSLFLELQAKGKTTKPKYKESFLGTLEFNKKNLTNV